jgi:hypothetical protein
LPAGPEGPVGEGALRRLGAWHVVFRRVGPVLDRSARLVWAVGVMTAWVSNVSTTVWITICPVVRSVTVLS